MFLAKDIRKKIRKLPKDEREIFMFEILIQRYCCDN